MSWHDAQARSEKINAIRREMARREAEHRHTMYRWRNEPDVVSRFAFEDAANRIGELENDRRQLDADPSAEVLTFLAARYTPLQERGAICGEPMAYSETDAALTAIVCTEPIGHPGLHKTQSGGTFFSSMEPPS